MRTDAETDGLLRKWFAEGPTRAHARVLDGLAAQIGGRRQRPAWHIASSLAIARLEPDRWVAGGAAAGLLIATALAVQFSGSPSGHPGPAASPSLAATQRVVATPSPGDRLSGTLLAAGTYASGEFARPLTYTVPEGWWKIGDDPTAFSLSAGDPNAPTTIIELLYDVYAPLVDDDGCQQTIEWDRGHGVDELVAYWELRPEFVVRKREAVSIGGLDGWRVVIAAPDGACHEASANAFVVHWSDGIPVTQGISGDTEMIALEDSDGRTLVAQVYPWNNDPTQQAEAEQIIESFEFDTEKVNIPGN